MARTKKNMQLKKFMIVREHKKDKVVTRTEVLGFANPGDEVTACRAYGGGDSVVALPIRGN